MAGAISGRTRTGGGDEALLKVMTYNIKSGRYHPDGLEAIARVVEAQAPDLLGLQEVDHDAPRSGHVDQARWLAERLGMGSHTFGPSFRLPDGGDYGNAVLSRYPIVTSAVRHLYYPTGHLLPQGADEPRSVLGAVIALGQARLNLLVTHLGLTPEQRWVQAGEVVAFALGWEPGNPLILMGDFNALPGSPEMGRVRPMFRDVLGEQPAAARPTFPSGPPGARTPDGWSGCIDYIFVGRGVVVEEARVVHEVTQASDHQPVVASLRVKTTADR